MRRMMKRAGAVVLSLAVAMSMLFSLAALPQMKVSAAGEMSRLKKWSLVAAMLGDDVYFTEKPTDETPEEPETPTTSDNNMMVIYAGLLLLSAMVMVVLFKKRRQEH